MPVGNRSRTKYRSSNADDEYRARENARAVFRTEQRCSDRQQGAIERQIELRPIPAKADLKAVLIDGNPIEVAQVR
jgi:hypothetical protein